MDPGDLLHHLVTADVERPEQHGPPADPIQDFPIYPPLFLLRQKVVSDKERELAPIEADAAGVHPAGHIDLAEQIDVRPDADAGAIDRRGLIRACALEAIGLAARRAEFAVFPDQILGRLYVDRALVG